ncbi:hypothetical protein J437_LFUL009212 [Ladona fulva]|uniref:Uncharacterized protein n=1 Tax=Ladona fulva TaxID=123851 RepID=A0A8K0P1I9_LADFU|nr:hypothetical protein J437_LFUL009212 [Ladona fulva]
MVFACDAGDMIENSERINNKGKTWPKFEFYGKDIAKVEGSSEIFIEADVVEFTVTIRSTKENFEEVKRSTSKRADYILYIVNKFKITDVVNTQTHQMLSKEDGKFHLIYEIEVKCSSFKIFEDVSNTITEKLDSCVEISLPRLKHSSKCQQESRETAVRLAVENARRKALQMAKVSGQKVGGAVYLEENICQQELIQNGAKNESDIKPKCIYKFISGVFAVYSLI